MISTGRNAAAIASVICFIPTALVMSLFPMSLMIEPTGTPSFAACWSGFTSATSTTAKPFPVVLLNFMPSAPSKNVKTWSL